MSQENRELLQMKDIRKQFPGVLVLNDVDFSVGYGEVHALMGENGAGKSTLIKILTGIYAADGGEIWMDGKRSISDRSTTPRRTAFPSFIRS